MKEFKTIILGKTSSRKNDILYVKEADLEMPHGEDYKIAISELFKIQQQMINKTPFHKLFEYRDISLWWYIFPNIIPIYKKITNFIISFQNIIDKYNPTTIKIETEFFSKFSVIKQICENNNIELQHSKIKLSKYNLEKSLKEKSQKTRFTKITQEKIDSRNKLFFNKFNKIPDISEKYVFAIPTVYRRKFFNFKKGVSENGEYIQQSIMDLLQNEQQIVGIDLDYTFRGDNKILKERLDDSLQWFPIDIILEKNSKDVHDLFLKKYQDILSTLEFQNLFTFHGISLWEHIENSFTEMNYAPNLPFYLRLIDSLFNFFMKNQPKAIFLPYETGPYALSIIKSAKQFKIKTIGVAHAFIAKHIPMYSHFQCETKNEPLGHPIPDTTLVFGEFAKNVLLENGYPEDAVKVFGNPAFFDLDKIEQKLHKKNLDEKYGIRSSQNIILFTTSKHQSYYSAHGTYDYDVEILKTLLENFSNNNDYFIILKPHPSEKNIEVYKKIIAKYGSKNIQIIRGDLFELLHLSSVVVSVYSTTMIDALCFKKPVIQVKFQTEIHPIPFEKYDTVLTSTISSLSDNIFTILNDDKLRNKLSKNRDIFLKEQYGLPEQNPQLELMKILNDR